MVRMEGLEPPCREALDPKSSASANFATSALMSQAIYISVFYKSIPNLWLFALL
jgi:hypothetical protein